MKCDDMKGKLYGLCHSSWKEISEKKIIIYGAGQGCIEMEDTLEIPNVFAVVDGCKELFGKNIMLLSRLYTIKSPLLLGDLEPEKYCVIVSSEKYYREIKDSIRHRYSQLLDVFFWKTEIKYAYDSLNALCYLDPIFRKKLSEAKSVRKTDEIIDAFTDFISVNQAINVNMFMPVLAGQSKISFIFGNQKRMWIFHYGGLVNTKSSRAIERENPSVKKLKEKYVIKHKLDYDLTIYRKKNVCVQKYVENRIDFTDYETLRQIMDVCRKLHSLSIDDLPDTRFERTFYYDFLLQIDAEHIVSRLLDKIRDIGDKCIRVITESNLRTVIHGDLTTSNIVVNDGQLQFIDWEYLSAGIPEIDICYFAYSISFDLYVKGMLSYDEMIERCNTDLLRIARYYYGKHPQYVCDEELVFSTLLVCIIRDILQSYLFDKKKGDEKAGILLKFFESGRITNIEKII